MSIKLYLIKQHSVPAFCVFKTAFCRLLQTLARENDYIHTVYRC